MNREDCRATGLRPKMRSGKKTYSQNWKDCDLPRSHEKASPAGACNAEKTYTIKLAPFVTFHPERA
jgi:hypothetical protein